MRRRHSVDATRQRGPFVWWGAIGVLLATGALTAVVLLPEATGTSFSGRGNSNPSSPPASGATSRSPVASGAVARSFAIAGSVGALFPGKTSDLMLVVSNPEKVVIRVTSIRVTVGNSSIGCTATDVVVTPFRGHLIVPAGKDRSATVHVTMIHSAPDACQGARFPFTYRGQATAG